MKKNLFVLVGLSVFVAILLSLGSCSKSNTGEYVDLGLPSGTKWKSQSESGLFTFYEAFKNYDGFLPTSGQFRELIDNCEWKWTGDGYKVTGRTGNNISLPAELEIHGEKAGAYWSVTKDGEDCCFGLLFYEEGAKVDRTCGLEDYDKKRGVMLCK